MAGVDRKPAVLPLEGKENTVEKRVELKEYGKVELGNCSVINNSSGEMRICGREISHDTKIGA